MLIFLIILLCIIISSARFQKPKTFNGDYMAPAHTDIIKGIFIFLVFLSHSAQYINLYGTLDSTYLDFRIHLGQLVVVMFFFYSGYGMMESMEKKGPSYITGLFKNRFLPTLLNYDIAVVIFLIVNHFIKYHAKTYELLLSFTAYTSVKNSNWYMFDIFVAYLLFIVSFIFFRNKGKMFRQVLGTTIFTILVFVFVLVQRHVNRPPYCYNTVLMMALGCWYSVLKERIEKLIKRNDAVYMILVFCAILGYCFTYSLHSTSIIVFTARSCFFAAIIILGTLKIKLDSNFLGFLGKHLFPIYILQRIPMNILEYFYVNEDEKYLFVIISFIATLALIAPFERLCAICKKHIIPS